MADITATAFPPTLRITITEHWAPDLLYLMRTEGKFDVDLFGRDSVNPENTRAVPAHKNILSAVSPHLRALFTSSGYTDSGLPTYNIPMVPHSSLQQLINFIYIDLFDVKNSDRFETVKNLLHTADYLMIFHIAVACDEFLAASSPQFDVRQWSFATKYDCAVVSYAISQQFIRNVNQMAQNPDFLQLTFYQCERIFTSKPVVTLGLQERLDLVTAWCEHSPVDRNKHSFELKKLLKPQEVNNTTLIAITNDAYANAAVRQNMNFVRVCLKFARNDQNVCSAWTTRGALATEIFHQLHDDSETCDVACIGSAPNGSYCVPIKAHKNILSACSPAFKRLFASTSTRTGPNNIPVFLVDEIDHSTLSNLIKLVYDETVVTYGRPINTCCSILAAAIFAGMSELANSCKRFLHQNIHVYREEAVQIWRAARKHLFNSLRSHTETYFAQHLPLVRVEKLLASLSFSEIYDISRSDALKAADKDQHCSFTLDWLEDQPNVTSAQVSDLLCSTSLLGPSLSTATMSRIVSSKLLQAAIPDKIFEAVSQTFERLQKNYPSLSYETPARLGREPKAWCIIPENPSGVSSILTYSIATEEWIPLESKPWTRRYASACIFDDTLTTFGGIMSDQDCRNVDQYSFSTKKWLEKLFFLEAPRQHPAVCSYNREAYILGGRNNSGSRRCEKFDCDLMQITQITSMSTPRYYFSAIPVPLNAFSCRVFVAGGRTASGISSNEIIQYIPETDTWSLVTRMVMNRSAHACALLTDGMYLLGGYEGNSAPSTLVEILNTETGRMRSFTPLPHGRDGCTATTLSNNNVICVFGDNSNRRREVDVCDVRDGHWWTGLIPPMPKDEAFFGFATY